MSELITNEYVGWYHSRVSGTSEKLLLPALELPGCFCAFDTFEAAIKLWAFPFSKLIPIEGQTALLLTSFVLFKTMVLYCPGAILLSTAYTLSFHSPFKI